MTNKDNDKLKVLFLDIETAPNLGWTWGKYEQNVIKFEKEKYMLCFTAKWADSNKLICRSIFDYPNYKANPESDKDLVRELWDLVDEADIIIAHNGDAFDIKNTNARFICNGLGPPSPYRTIDTLKLAKKYFAFNSNKLNDLGTVLGLGNKLSTGGFQLWLDCMAGKKVAWTKMKNYNKQDVILLEKVYNSLKRWMTNHPNIAINVTKPNCHCCGSTEVQKRGFGYTRMTKYQRYQCVKCGSWSQARLEK